MIDDHDPEPFLVARRDWLRVEAIDRGDGWWDVGIIIDGTYSPTAGVSRAEMVDYFTRWLAVELAGHHHTTTRRTHEH